MKQKMKKLSEAEQDVMNVLWSFDHPARPVEIMPIITQQHAWSLSTVNTLLSRLVEKQVAKLEYVEKHRFYSPAMTQDEYLNRTIGALASRLSDISPIGQIAAFIDSMDMTEEDLDEIDLLLQAAREKLKKDN
jgi:predicted transcriptional regulator